MFNNWNATLARLSRHSHAARGNEIIFFRLLRATWESRADAPASRCNPDQACGDESSMRRTSWAGRSHYIIYEHQAPHFYLVPTCHVGIQGGRASVPLQSRSDMRGRELNEEDFMGRSRYIIYEHQAPHLLTCTFNNWIATLARLSRHSHAARGNEI